MFFTKNILSIKMFFTKNILNTKVYFAKNTQRLNQIKWKNYLNATTSILPWFPERSMLLWQPTALTPPRWARFLFGRSVSFISKGKVLVKHIQCRLRKQERFMPLHDTLAKKEPTAITYQAFTWFRWRACHYI